MTSRRLVGWLPVVEYCAEEVARQQASPRHVGYMVDAWRIAIQDFEAPRNDFNKKPVSTALILKLGATIEPWVNGGLDAPNGHFRRVRVQVGDRVCPDPEEVPRLMDALVEAQCRLKPEEFYYEFELIHPFRDGNGRTGKILLNYLNGSLMAPIWPPDFWGIANP